MIQPCILAGRLFCCFFLISSSCRVSVDEKFRDEKDKKDYTKEISRVHIEEINLSTTQRDVEESALIKNERQMNMDNDKGRHFMPSGEDVLEMSGEMNLMIKMQNAVEKERISFLTKSRSFRIFASFEVQERASNF